VGSEERFAKYLQESRPVVMQALYLGGCVEKWSLEYLLKAIGGDRKVTTHRHLKRLLSCHNRRNSSDPKRQYSDVLEP
jgi:hypothetical protein